MNENICFSLFSIEKLCLFNENVLNYMFQSGVTVKINTLKTSMLIVCVDLKNGYPLTRYHPDVCSEIQRCVVLI